MCLKFDHKINIPPTVIKQIIDALKNSSFLWRTSEGIAKEIKQNQTVVFNFLYHSDNIIKSRGTNKKGEQLFAYREKYLKEIPLKVKLINTITGEFH